MTTINVDALIRILENAKEVKSPEVKNIYIKSAIKVLKVERENN